MPRRDFRPITTQADLDRVLEARLDRHRLQVRQLEAEHAATVQQLEDEYLHGLGWLRRALVEATTRTEAARLRFINPDHGPRLIDLDDIEVTTTGQVNTDTIRTRLEAVLATDPAFATRERTPA